ncbi:MAG TPA: hypothetical protein VES68_01230 [Candidatus Sulfotelmatobacter sp.]|nr:hypothetical protein [Candidatus Sulfotelmatobacter sp.]
MKYQILKRKKLIVIIFAVILIAGLYFYFQYKNGNQLLTGNSNTLQEQQSLIEKVGNLIVLPLNENPQIATVSDKTKLKDQAFFANAENGDKVLIYNSAGEAILYRPSINKIIAVAPINTITSQQSPNSSSSASQQQNTAK